MSSNMRQKDIRPAPARIEFKGMKFLITDRPSDLTIQNYILVRRKIKFWFCWIILFYVLFLVVEFYRNWKRTMWALWSGYVSRATRLTSSAARVLPFVIFHLTTVLHRHRLWSTIGLRFWSKSKSERIFIYCFLLFKYNLCLVTKIILRHAWLFIVSLVWEEHPFWLR